MERKIVKKKKRLSVLVAPSFAVMTQAGKEGLVSSPLPCLPKHKKKMQNE
jgi:hypothetical protein